jgi:hypothetical protein
VNGRRLSQRLSKLEATGRAGHIVSLFGWGKSSDACREAAYLRRAREWLESSIRRPRALGSGRGCCSRSHCRAGLIYLSIRVINRLV